MEHLPNASESGWQRHFVQEGLAGIGSARRATGDGRFVVAGSLVTMTGKERFALGSLIAIAVAGHGVRLIALGPGDAPGGLTLTAGLVPGNPALHRALSERVGRPLGPSERIDLNASPAEEIARLPKVGLSLAKAVVRWRTEQGGIASLEELDRIDGIGPGLLAAIANHAALGDTEAVRRRRAGRGVAVAAAPQPVGGPLVVRPVIRVARKPAPDRRPPLGPVHLNSASQADFERLPGIGPGRAKAIVAYRQTNGPFASISDLGKVPGLPRRLVRQLATQVAVP